MNFRKARRGRKQSNLGHGKPGRITSLTPKRGRPVRTKGKSHGL